MSKSHGRKQNSLEMVGRKTLVRELCTGVWIVGVKNINQNKETLSVNSGKPLPSPKVTQE